MRNVMGAVFVAILLVGCGLSGDNERPAAAETERVEPTTSVPPLRVFFVGNSHTYYNDMPTMIAGLARAGQQVDPLARGFEHGLDAPGGWNLEDHLKAARLSKQLRGSRWDYVVLQEQQQRPSFRFNPSQVEREFYSPARTLDIMIKVAGAKTLLYLTAARLNGDPDNVSGDTYQAMQDRVRDSYRILGAELGAQVVPVGLAFASAHQQRPDLALWDTDGKHPSRLGSYLTACVFYAALYAKSPEGNAYLAGLPEADARFVQHAAVVPP